VTGIRWSFAAMLWVLGAVPSSAAELVSAQSLTDRAATLAPELLTLMQLDTQIATRQNPHQQEALALRRHQTLQQVIRRVFSGQAADLVPAPSTATLEARQAAVQQARKRQVRLETMTALLQLNTVVLNAAFARLLEQLAHQWSSFATTSRFERAFTAYEHDTRFDVMPFDQALSAIQALPAAERTLIQNRFLVAYQGYRQRAASYDAVVTSLHAFIRTATEGDLLLRWLGVGTLIKALDDVAVLSALNTTWFPSGAITLGQIVMALAFSLALMVMGFLLLPWLTGLILRSVAGSQSGSTVRQSLIAIFSGALRAPFSVLLVVIAVTVAGRILLLRQPETTLINVTAIVVILVLVWGLLRLIDSLVIVYSEHLHQRHLHLRGELVNFASNTLRILVVTATALYLLHDLGYDITTLLASLGIGGLALAFAAKETLANMFGCISIIADDMFHQGDWIATPETQGTVIDVGLRSTKIRTSDNAIVFLPNADVASAAVHNQSRRKLGRRIQLILRLEYGSDMARVRKTIDDIRTMLTQHAEIADSCIDPSEYVRQPSNRVTNAMDSQGVMHKLLVYLDELGENSINILIDCYSKKVDREAWLAVKQDVLFRCCDIVAANGLSTALPSRTLYWHGHSPRRQHNTDQLY
jgi:small-conductance mechanosensitive channel